MCIWNSIKMQVSLMVHRLSFKVGFSLVLLYCMASYIATLLRYGGVDVSHFYSANFLYAGNQYATYWGIFQSVFPFLVVFPFAFSYLDDRNAKVTPYILSRINKKNYFLGKIVTCFLGGFVIVSIPFLLNLILCNVTFKENYNTVFGPFNLSPYDGDVMGSTVVINTDFKSMSFLNCYVISPLLYNILYLFIFSFFSGILSMLAGACSYFVKKYKIVLFIPIYVLIFMSKSLDGFLYQLNDKINYVNLNWMKYVSVNSYYGRSYGVFSIFLASIVIFCLFSIWYVSRKDII